MNATSLSLSRRSFLARDATLVGGATVAATGITLATQGSASAGAGWFPGMLVTVNTDALNLRTDATRASNVIATYPYGTTATVLDQAVQADDLIWVYVQVTDDCNEGWFATEFLAPADGNRGGGGNNSPSVTVVSGPLNLLQDPGRASFVGCDDGARETGTSNGNTVDKDGYTWLQVQMNDGKSEYFAIDFISIEGFGGGGDGGNSPAFTVINGPLNLRSEAGLSGAILSSYATSVTGVALMQESVQADGYMWGHADGR